MSQPRLFHFALPVLLHAARAAQAAQWAPASLAGEGFIHLSFAEQLGGTLAAHFVGVPQVLLFEVRLDDRSALRVEASRGYALFPHLYRALEWRELAAHWPLAGPTPAGAGTPAANESWGLPNFGSTPVLDYPVGRHGLPGEP